MYGNLEPNGFIEDNPHEFATKAVQLYNNEVLWKEKQLNGLEIINTRFNKVSFEKDLIYKVYETSKQLSNQRLNNFIGQMLQHHSLQSTKYMSKWIEEKNKKE